MLEEKLIVGRIIDFSFPPVTGVEAPPDSAGFKRMPQSLMNINESTGVFTKTSAITAGSHATKPWRTFGWLPWLPGWIAEVQMGANDVLTGPMSGCDLVLYRRKDGSVYAGHVGTDVNAPNPAQNEAVKVCWRNFAASAEGGNVIGGFNPTRGWKGPYPAAQAGDVGLPTFFGLYTASYEFYSMVVYSQRLAPGNALPHPTLRRIAGLQQITAMGPSQLRTLSA